MQKSVFIFLPNRKRHYAPDRVMQCRFLLNGSRIVPYKMT